ncbi:hypothetical protein KY289_011217 [Solanum tuberosum]|nr:hypothetical protein KY289_011217 [Solanum tuberosum]
MAGAVPSTLPHTLKFVWNHKEIVVHGKVWKSWIVHMMVAWEMMKNGFILGQGLGAKLNGIVEPIQLPGQKYTFGLGYEPTLEEVSSANLIRKTDIPLPQPIPLLNQSFSKAFIAQELEETTKDSLVKGLKNLFIDEVKCNMILEDYIEGPTIWNVMT